MAVTADLQLASRRGSGVAVDAAGSCTALVLGDDRRHGRRGRDSSPNDDADERRPHPVVVPGRADRPGRTTARLVADDLLAWEALAVTLTAADLVGVMEGTLELAADYAK